MKPNASGPALAVTFQKQELSIHNMSKVSAFTWILEACCQDTVTSQVCPLWLLVRGSKLQESLCQQFSHLLRTQNPAPDDLSVQPSLGRSTCLGIWKATASTGNAMQQEPALVSLL